VMPGFPTLRAIFVRMRPPLLTFAIAFREFRGNNLQYPVTAEPSLTEELGLRFRSRDLRTICAHLQVVSDQSTGEGPV
jgi:hypothetical protein